MLVLIYAIDDLSPAKRVTWDLSWGKLIMKYNNDSASDYWNYVDYKTC